MAGAATVGAPTAFGSSMVRSQSRTCAAVGRAAGSLARHASTRSRRPASIGPRSAGAAATRCASAAGDESANGDRPAAANPITEPKEKMSLAGPTSRTPATSSGDRNAGVPITGPRANGVPSPARAIPKSTSRGPSAASTTLDGFRSRCTSPAPCSAASPSASRTASATVPWRPSGPCCGHERMQRRALDVGDGEPRRIGVRVGVEHGGDEPRRRCGRHLHLVAEPVAEPRLGGQLRMHHPDRGLPAGLVHSEQHAAHRPDAELARHSVATHRGRFGPGMLLVHRAWTLPVSERHGSPVIWGQSPSAPTASTAAPSCAFHSASDPSSSRQAHRRVVSSRRSCSRVNPIAPWTWWAIRATAPAASDVRALAAAIANRPAAERIPSAVAVRGGGGRGRRRRRDLGRSQRELLLHGLEAADRAAELHPLPRVPRRTPRARPARPRRAAGHGPARHAAGAPRPPRRGHGATASAGAGDLAPASRGSSARFVPSVTVSASGPSSTTRAGVRTATPAAARAHGTRASRRAPVAVDVQLAAHGRERAGRNLDPGRRAAASRPAGRSPPAAPAPHARPPPRAPRRRRRRCPRCRRRRTGRVSRASPVSSSVAQSPASKPVPAARASANTDSASAASSAFSVPFVVAVLSLIAAPSRARRSRAAPRWCRRAG